MSSFHLSRRDFLKTAGVVASAALLSPPELLTRSPTTAASPSDTPADYTLTIATKPVELAPNRIVSVTTYNGQFPGPLLRLKEGERVTVDIRNETDTPEQLHWHGQFLSTDVDGAAEEGTPFIPPHGSRRISFEPRPSGFRFYHTHVRAGANLADGPVQRTGRTGLYRTETACRQLRPRSLPHAERVSADVEPRRRHGDGLPLAGDDGRAAQEQWREQDEGFARQGHAARLRSRLRIRSPSMDACWAMASRCA